MFYKHLTGYDFAAQRDNSAVPVHFRNIKHIKHPLLRPPTSASGRTGSEGGARMVEVVFPGKEFMIDKYINQLIINNEKLIIKEKEIQTSVSSATWANIKKKLLIIRSALPLGFAKNSKLLIKFWWLWYPYRWFTALRALVGLRR